ncbi:isoflavone reductase family protein [Pyrenochaeta sp. DS3sAY3a]|nr:isoflavone reductase family protein [Pyrenochaeta sp. DS3sAY3a]
MHINKILLLGNWDLCLTITNALISSEQSDSRQYEVTVLTYPAQSLSLPPHVSPSMIQHKKSDFSPQSLQTAFAGYDLVISTMSGGDSELQKRIVDAVISAKVRRFIPHEFAHDTLNKGIQSRITKYAGRGKVIEYLRTITQTDPEFEWAAIATGYTLDTNLISGDLGLDFTWYSATIHGIGTESFAASSLERVGTAIASVILHWEEVKNQYIYSAGMLTSANEVLRSAEKITGQRWTVGNYDVEECIREGEARIQRGFPDSGMFLLERSILYDEQLDASAPFRLRSANNILQLEPEVVEAVVVKAYHDLKHHGKPGCGCSS